ncbi:hypothetical protein D7030_00820 [Flavobacteriaceae bacterium AU392]|nr:hypothetical protein D1817_03105 [Flavobacteriaceae bacterium]RKM86600.1 hypothetical protein D7030_00820 [Flavobacteriaceae bacterium AU392]
MRKIGFIGVGKIASAVVEGLCTSKIENVFIHLSPRNSRNSSALASKFSNVKKMSSNQEVINTSDIIFITLRPLDAKRELENLRFNKHHIVISLIPYLLSSELHKIVKPANHVSRAIPLPTVINHNCPIPIFNPNETILEIFNYIGQPLVVKNEKELHSIWTLTGLITPLYNLMGELSDWTQENGVSKEVSNKYVSDLFQSLAYAAQNAKVISFEELANHAATPNGMNEQAGKEIRGNGSHNIYRDAANNLLSKFTQKINGN